MKSSPDGSARGAKIDNNNRLAFMFPKPPATLEFDGERYVSGVLGDIQVEHYHRYLFALRFCAGKDVVDIASGEGYGSALLGQTARSVIGVDVSTSAVDFANRAYLSQNVSYRCGDASAMPIETASVDVVVSFETLEHLSDHEGFFREIRRILRPDGLLVMSSPNRPVFHSQYGDDNHFHVRELDRLELAETLDTHFKYHHLLEQRAISGSVIFGAADSFVGPVCVEGFDSSDGLLFERHRGVPNPPYFLAVASDFELLPPVHSVMHSPAYLAHLEQIRLGLEKTIENVSADSDRVGLVLSQTQRELQLAGEAIAATSARLGSAEGNLAGLKTAHEALLHEKNGLTNQVDILKQERSAALLSIAQADWQCADLNRRLAEATDRLDMIESSTSWKITYFPRRLLLRYPGSARALRRMVKAVWWLITGRLFGKIRDYRRVQIAEMPAVAPLRGGHENTHTTPEALNEQGRDFGFTRPGPGYEVVDPTLFNPAERRAKIVALYLPQFHPIPENDAWWGRGFTEWRNVVTAKPWFSGHFQPRLPRDLGYYDLRLVDTIRAQVALAQSCGIFGFSFYYYFFNGKRVLETPVELFLADRSIDFPFCVLWANENWTRRWDGHDSEVLLHQDYRPEDDTNLIDDLARHFKDPRYICIQGRPLFVIYRVNLIPDAANAIARWRELLRTRHNLNPYIFMVQGFGTNDPGEFGLDGALEFPPHKLAENLPSINDAVDGIHREFKGRIVDYSSVIERSLVVEKPPFDLIRAVMQAWDNVPRRGAHGAVYHGSTPQKFGSWLGSMIEFARRHPVGNESLVFVNAWNEWAEGTTLEPDVYWGGAYLNSVARAVSGTVVDASEPLAPEAVAGAKPKLLIVGHDAYRHGAQLNCLALVRHMRECFGLEVTVILLGTGPLEASYRAIAPTHVIEGDSAKLNSLIASLSEDGYRWAICNTVVTGQCVPVLKGAGFTVVSLVHEMPALIRERGLESAAQDLADYSDKVVFAADHVSNQFATIAAVGPGKTVIAPQGLYQELPVIEGARALLRERLRIPDDAVVILNAGYGDVRKGIDLFIELAGRIVDGDDRFHFVWLGDLEEGMDVWAKRLAVSPETLKHVHQVGFSSEIAEYFQAADVFVLTSREDPFPSVVLEALAYGLPVVAFDGGGGCVDVVSQDGNGILTPYLDVAALAEAVREVAFFPEFVAPDRRAERMSRTRRQFDFRRFSFDLLRIFQPGLKAVTVVVPNYNYAHHIGQRLDSVFAQTYPIFEVLVLDDASTDDSLDTLEGIRLVKRRDFALRVNNQNSGSVFKQWASGVGVAQGELLWIAEADDLSSPDFVEVLAREFADPGLNMVFSDSRQIDENAAPLAESYSFYYAQRLPGLLATTKLPGLEFLKQFLSVRNAIFNVSAVLFRKDALAEALQASTAEFDMLRVAGDWNVYVELCSQQGSIAYVAKALNTHRRHGASVTLSMQHWRHIAEIFAIHRKVRSVLGSDGIVSDQAAYIAELTQQFGLTPPEGKSVELIAAVKWLDDLSGDDRILFAALRKLPVDLVGEILLDVPAEYPAARAALPRMPSDEVQVSWTGSHGATLLRQSCGFVRAVDQGFLQYAGRSLENVKILDYGCGWGRLIRLMYKFTAPENLYACDPWDRSIQLCEESNIRANLIQSEYLPTASPFPDVKFDLIYAFSVFTHLSERSATTVMAVFRQAVADNGICVVTIRPVSYWDVHDQAQNVVDRDAMKKAHEARGFAFTPHQREAVDGDITYGDTSISLDYIHDNWTDWEVVGSNLFEHDPFQTLVFLKPVGGPNSRNRASDRG